MLVSEYVNALRSISAWCLLVAVGIGSSHAATTAQRFTFEDITAVRDVADPQIAPEGAWIAYTVTANDLEKDKRVTHIWMTSWDGKQTAQLTNSDHSEHTPRWSP